MGFNTLFRLVLQNCWVLLKIQKQMKFHGDGKINLELRAALIAFSKTSTTPKNVRTLLNYDGEFSSKGPTAYVSK